MWPHPLPAGYTSKVNYSNNRNLTIGVGAAEAMRLVAMLLLSRVHDAENLATL